MDPFEHIVKKYGLSGNDNPQKIKGMNREGLYQLFADLGYKLGAEVGLEKGKNALTMFRNIPDLKLYGIDPYKQHAQASYDAAAQTRHWNAEYLSRIKHRAKRALRGQNHTMVQAYSEDAVRQFEDNSLDFVYIDADHSYDFVMLDLILWGRKVKKGGIISGHDYYYDNNKAGRRAKVTQAINDYTKLHGIKFFITDEDHYVMRGDAYPSWFWVKLEDIYPNVVGF